MSKPRLIAFYLPQFYPTPENDEWWKPGFTEWTNVASAKPLFKGHYQPHVPRDLGFYDLRVPETREKQAQLAREAGIEGFCYWHYWFNGKRLLDRVFKEVVESGKPDFPFCLCWANHSWYKKTWDPSKGKDVLLIEQTYPGVQDYINHFNAMLPAFKDSRYMRADGKLIFGVYSPLSIPDTQLFFDTWQTLAKQNGLPGFYFFGFAVNPENELMILKNGYNSVVSEYLVSFKYKSRSIYQKIINKIWGLFNKCVPLSYEDYCQFVLDHYHSDDNHHACISPNFDHSPRSGVNGVILNDATPKKWGNLCFRLFQTIEKRNSDTNLVFIKAWNEWGEGNHLEPDIKYGMGFLNEIKKCLSSI